MLEVNRLVLFLSIHRPRKLETHSVCLIEPHATVQLEMKHGLEMYQENGQGAKLWPGA